MSILATKLRTLISQDRIRHEELSLNIDLTYITNRVLAMSFPATGIEAAWRNDIADVCTLLRSKHKDNFLVWNLSERDYQYELLDNQIVCVPFKDHHAPPLHIIFQIIHHIDSWLRANPQHVAIVHCMGGKGRTGLVIVCYLFYSGLFTDVSKCLSYFALRRSAKGKGVTQPSQLRYVRYYSDVVSSKKTISIPSLTLQKIVIGPIPKGIYVFMEIYQQSFAEATTNNSPTERILYSTLSASSDARVVNREGKLYSECNVELSGDILLRGYYIDGKSKPKSLFRMQFYIGLLESYDMVVPRDQLDDMHKEKKKFPLDFELRMTFIPKQSTDQDSAYNVVFNHMRDMYKEMLLCRVKTSDTEIENTPGRHVNWQQGRYGSLTNTLLTNTDTPPKKGNEGSMRQRYRESMLQVKPPPQPPVIHDLATRQRYLNRQLDYLEAQLTEIEAMFSTATHTGVDNVNTSKGGLEVLSPSANAHCDDVQ